jgi:hypothetical protein
MKYFELKSRKLLRTIFGCISFTAVAFVFQACYGPPADWYYDIRIIGTVRSKSTQLPIQGIKIAAEYNNFGMSDEEGKFDFYATYAKPEFDSLRIDFLDIDSIENGHFADKRITIATNAQYEVNFDVELEEIE